MNVYGDQETERWFLDSYKASGKRLDMGKSCVRFKSVDDLPLDLVGEAVARTSVDDYIALYETAPRPPVTPAPSRCRPAASPPPWRGS